jgi:hypothetical protein
MLPPIAVVDSVEMVRDGGSLAAIFHGTDSCEYSLLLEILSRKLDYGDVERLGYAAPKIVSRLTNSALPITWQHAAVLLCQIGGMIRREKDLKWHGVMAQVVETRGELPNEFERVLRAVRF